MKVNLFLFCFMFFSMVFYCATDSSKVPLRVKKLEKAPNIDGILDDEVWSHAISIDDFLQRAPVEGSVPTERTVVYLYYTASSLYIGLKAYDSDPQKIAATTMKRDDFSITGNDQFVIVIDSYNSNRNGYWFSTNPLGARVDAQFFDEGEIWEDNWNGIWNCKSAITPEGWTSEIEIPFSTLRFENKEEVIMGMNFFRRIIRTNEQIFSPLIPLSVPYGTPRVSYARKFVFTGINYGRNVTFQPYAVGKFTSLNGNRMDKNSDAGFDFRYNLTDNIVANLSYNIDFAQAEVDDQQINLSRFSYFYPEKRDFFLENSGIFAVGAAGENQVYFSRRIGLREVSQGQYTGVPIIYGMKMTGKMDDFNIGLMNLQTLAQGNLNSQNFSVGRVKYERPNMFLSGMTTVISDKKRLFNTSAVDFYSKIYGDAAFYGFAGVTSKSTESTNLKDNTSMILGVYQSGERTAYSVNYMYVGNAYDPEMGYVRWKGVNMYKAEISVPCFIEKEFLWKIIPKAASVNYFNLNGGREYYQQTLQVDFASQSEDVLSFSAIKYFEKIPYDYNIFKSNILSKGEYIYNRFAFSINSKSGRDLSGGVNINAGQFYNGKMFEINPSFNWKVYRHLTISQFYISDFVNLSGISFTTKVFRTNLSYSFNTEWSFGGSVQYNNSSESILTNLRISYIPSDGIALYLIYNSNSEKNELLNNMPYSEESSRIILLKFNYLFKI